MFSISLKMEKNTEKLIYPKTMESSIGVKKIKRI